MKCDSHSGEVNEVLQQAQADRLAFLGMKLRGVNIIAPDGGGEGLPVRRARRYDGLIGGLRKKAVDEIDVAAARNAAKQRAIRLCQLDPVPADLRDFQPRFFGETHHRALEYAHARGATVELLALFKQRLVADANSE